MKKTRTPFMTVRLEVAFEEREMHVLRADFPTRRRAKLTIVTPVFRLPDGTEFAGHRIGPELRAKIALAGKPKGIRR